MDFLNFREPVAAWSHGAWFLLALPGAWLLWRRAAGNLGRQLVLVTYVACLAFCAAASLMYHAVQGSDERIAAYLLFDHIGIYLLIAGTYTPIAWTLMGRQWRRATLAFVWLAAALGTGIRLGCADLPTWLSTSIYLAMGWGSIICFIELSRIVSRRALRPITIGGILYSVGAAFHVLGWPIIWPGVIHAHELFHFLVVAGSLAHFHFIHRVVAPWPNSPEAALQAARSPRSNPIPVAVESQSPLVAHS